MAFEDEREDFYFDDDGDMVFYPVEPDEEWYDEPEYDNWYPDPTWRDKLIANVRFWFHLLRMRVDKNYAEHINDIPF